ncbi:hypothetical protein WOLCODRAFT_137860, partial [Wolfiporia cocos MD-104 SS10]
MSDCEDDQDIEQDVDIDEQSFYNPFDRLPQGESAEIGAIVIGSPGIGKSVFLIYVLALRLLARLTTILQLDNEAVYVLNDEGVFRIDPIKKEDQLHLYIPDGTWCLIDSNQDLVRVPTIYPQLCFSCKGFILQAASPRAERVDWTKKVAQPVPRFWMAHWSLGELIIGRDLQLWRKKKKKKKKKPSESQIASFVKLYGTSARRVYACAARPDRYKEELYSKIRSLSRHTMPDLLDHVPAGEMDDAISHEILVATPHPRNREKYGLHITTEHLWGKVLDQLNNTEDKAADMLYQLFTRDSHTRAGAGYLLERAFLVEFPNGGEWPMTAMSKSPRSGKRNTHWHSIKAFPLQYLRLGYQDQIIAIAKQQINPSIKKFDRLAHRHFSRGQVLKLEDAFYTPRSRSQPSFDAFVYETGSQRATIFQVTVSNQQPISTEGLDWLYGLGVKSVVLVVVTPPLYDDDVEDIWVANSHADKLDKVYHLVQSDLKKCSVEAIERASDMPTSTAGGRVAAALHSSHPRDTLSYKSNSKKEKEKPALPQPVQSARKKGDASDTAL